MADVFAFQSLRAFLVSSFEERRATKSGWTLRAWARHLKTTDAPALSRVLKGERAASAALVDALVRYFGFSAPEEEYFRCLALLDRDADPAFHQAILFRLQGLASAQIRRRSRVSGDDALISLRGRQLAVWGWAPPAAVNERLAQAQLEAAVFMGQALVGVVAQDYQESTLLPCVEVYCAAFAKPVGSGLPSLLYQGAAAISEPSLVGYARSVGRANTFLASVRMTGAPYVCVVEDDRRVLELSMAEEPPAHEQYDQDSELLVYAGGGTGRQSNRVQYRLIGARRDFDPHIDTCVWRSDSAFGAWMDGLGFKPAYWMSSATMICKVFRDDVSES